MEPAQPKQWGLTRHIAQLQGLPSQAQACKGSISVHHHGCHLAPGCRGIFTALVLPQLLGPPHHAQHHRGHRFQVGGVGHQQQRLASCGSVLLAGRGFGGWGGTVRAPSRQAGGVGSWGDYESTFEQCP